eukprot:TRINITY_DN6449_c0_g1_i1.p1 TRINITY_DN6449_c0_g1~~TRINITY_DN6449_c0_g1_i1.p1  ORF type:complete len:609 (-),score=246.40 TRINITY_DN6449_c0_g1_i1:90-1916(-)
MKAFVVFCLIFSLVPFCYCYKDDWEVVSKSNPHKMLNFRVALKVRNVDELQRIVDDITNPYSENFREYKTMEELTKIIAPTEKEQLEVIEYFYDRNIFEVNSYGDFIEVSASIAQLESSGVFGIEENSFFTYSHNEKAGNFVDRSNSEIIIPEELKHIVNFVSGVANFPFINSRKTPIKHLKRSTDSILREDDPFTVPQTIRNMYNIPSDLYGKNETNSQAVVEFSTSAGISESDLITFNNITGGLSNQSLSYTVGPFKTDPLNPVNGESTLDVEYIMSIGGNISTSFWVVDGWIYDFTTLVQTRQQNNKPVPYVFSISYGWAEDEQCQITGQGTSCKTLGGTSQDYVDATNVNFMKLAGTGLSIFIASGDAGAATKKNLLCLRPFEPIRPDYPAAAPYVTAVGATMFNGGGNSFPQSNSSLPSFCQQEKCASSGDPVVCSIPEALITSGGGFSNYAPRLSFTNNAVQSWNSSGALQPESKYFNQSGRAYPDISALGHKYLIVEGGNNEGVDGTSCSTPVVAGMFSLINDVLLNNGRKPVGFINQALYAMPSTNFNDITVGNNTGTEETIPFYHCHTEGYGAAVGYDPVTGFGTPNFQNILNYYMGPN